jgi:hypothetical protein
MRKIAGLVFDVHDDLDGRVLRAVLPDPQTVPDFIKTAHRLTDDQTARLTDDNFALVMFNEGTKLKKYAMVDKGNVALSVMYLGHQAHLLPPEAVKTAAVNLCGACQVHGLTAPDWLKVAAEVGLSGVSGKAQAPYAKKAKVNKINFPVPESPKQTTENPRLGLGDVDKDLEQRTNMAGVQGENFKELPIFSQKEKKPSASDLTMQKNASVQVVTRERTTRTSPYVDVSGWDPEAHEVTDHKAPEQTLLNGKYPVDSYDQVKTAADYFRDHRLEFHPRDRHQYCIKLAGRMEELGMEVPEDVGRYGSETYAGDVDQMVQARRGLVTDEFRPALDLLLEKRAQVSPGTFAEAVAEFDNMTNLRYYWDANVPDPWYSTFGPSMEKMAAAEWTYNEQGVFISLQDLESLALNGKTLVKKQFGQDFIEQFAKKPQAVFDSLPKPTKLILARMASDKHAGTATE